MRTDPKLERLGRLAKRYCNVTETLHETLHETNGALHVTNSPVSPNDPKWLWIIILCLAGESPVPGTLLISEGMPYTVEELAEMANLPEAVVEAIIEDMEALGMVAIDEGEITVCNWSKRQFTSDNSTERVRRHREKKNVNRQGNETLQKRYSNVTETETKRFGNAPDTDTDTDTDNKEMTVNAFEGDEAETEVVERLVLLYNRLSPVTGNAAIGVTVRRNKEIRAALLAGCPPDVLEQAIRELGPTKPPWEVRVAALERAGLGGQKNKKEYFNVERVMKLVEKGA